MQFVKRAKLLEKNVWPRHYTKGSTASKIASYFLVELFMSFFDFKWIVRMLIFIRNINLGLGSLSPLQIAKNCCENSQTENFFKNDQNIGVCQWKKSKDTKSFTHTKCQKLLWKPLNWKFFQTCSGRWDLSGK